VREEINKTRAQSAARNGLIRSVLDGAGKLLSNGYSLNSLVLAHAVVLLSAFISGLVVVLMAGGTDKDQVKTVAMDVYLPSLTNSGWAWKAAFAFNPAYFAGYLLIIQSVLSLLAAIVLRSSKSSYYTGSIIRVVLDSLLIPSAGFVALTAIGFSDLSFTLSTFFATHCALVVMAAFELLRVRCLDSGFSSYVKDWVMIRFIVTAFVSTVAVLPSLLVLGAGTALSDGMKNSYMYIGFIFINFALLCQPLINYVQDRYFNRISDDQRIAIMDSVAGNGTGDGMQLVQQWWMSYEMWGFIANSTLRILGLILIAYAYKYDSGWSERHDNFYSCISSLTLNSTGGTFNVCRPPDGNTTGNVAWQVTKFTGLYLA